VTHLVTLSGLCDVSASFFFFAREVNNLRESRLGYILTITTNHHRSDTCVPNEQNHSADACLVRARRGCVPCARITARDKHRMSTNQCIAYCRTTLSPAGCTKRVRAAFARADQESRHAYLRIHHVMPRRPIGKLFKGDQL
jgi:hypothetical protein